MAFDPGIGGDSKNDYEDGTGNTDEETQGFSGHTSSKRARRYLLVEESLIKIRPHFLQVTFSPLILPNESSVPQPTQRFWERSQAWTGAITFLNTKSDFNFFKGGSQAKIARLSRRRRSVLWYGVFFESCGGGIGGSHGMREFRQQLSICNFQFSNNLQNFQKIFEVFCPGGQ